MRFRYCRETRATLFVTWNVVNCCMNNVKRSRVILRSTFNWIVLYTHHCNMRCSTSHTCNAEVSRTCYKQTSTTTNVVATEGDQVARPGNFVSTFCVFFWKNDPSQTVASARTAPKICQGQPPTFGSQYSRSHPNRFTFGGVIAERVNVVFAP